MARIGTIIVVLFLVLLAAVMFNLRFSEPSDIPGRAQAALARQSSVVLETFVNSSPPRYTAFCGGTIVSPTTVLTAYHCAVAIQKFYVETLSGDVQPAAVLVLYQGYDLALLQVPQPLAGRVASLVPDVAVGETVFVVGAPNRKKFLTTQGIVAYIDRGSYPDNCPGVSYPFGTQEHQQIYTTAATFFGNSGGGMFNVSGQLAGVLVRGETADRPNSLCSDDYQGEHILWGLTVGVETLREVIR